MKNDAAAILDDLLCRWHAWASTKPAQDVGYPTTNATCRLYRTSRQYDDSNGALDGDLDARIMEAVDSAIDQLSSVHRSAIHAHARNLASGYEVWSNPRLPTDQAERAALVDAARAQLMSHLRGLGVA